ncbi:hypothetical protein NFK08_17230 [Enterobacter roggenkampii]|uniref:hypothetical protein n=1 Tax=Enterobacter roggenkampii TaxID=1812935 RepID=UPI00242DD56E|nr:hypothetical protein [Enterobacter roggenkampii]WFX57479.1 hypothetical protein NFK08_17230 [Enterobacter roggenkampii]
MNINFDIVIDSKEHQVDMDYGLKTLAGTSRVVSTLAEAILKQEVSERRTSVNDIRTQLKQSFKSSYGQNFCIEINDPVLKRKLKRIGNDVFCEVMSYFIAESLFLEPNKLSAGATVIVAELENIEDKLIDVLRRALVDMHKITAMNSFNVELNHKPRGDRTRIAMLTPKTAQHITETEEGKREYQITVIFTRFNSMTGNGRLIVQGDDQTTAFGLAKGLRHVPLDFKKKITENLHRNNGLHKDNWHYITLTVHDLKLGSGEVVKYFIHEIS